MNGDWFDAVVRSAGRRRSRRGVIAALGLGLIAGAIDGRAGAEDASDRCPSCESLGPIPRARWETCARSLKQGGYPTPCGACDQTIRCFGWVTIPHEMRQTYCSAQDRENDPNIDLRLRQYGSCAGAW
jgi:hypothetical protein